MFKFEVKDVVCDYGVYCNGQLLFILNSKRIAKLIVDRLKEIVDLLKEDEILHRELNSNNILL